MPAFMPVQIIADPPLALTPSSPSKTASMLKDIRRTRTASGLVNR